MSKHTGFYVYELVRPDGRVFYVGKGCRSRVNQHESEARSNCHCYKCNVIRKIWREGGQIEKRIVFKTANEQEAYDYEADLIKFYGRENLTNKSDGGEVPRNYSIEGRRKISEANRKKIHTPESKKKRSEAAKNKKHTPETIEKIRAWHKGRQRSEETRRKIAIASKGRITPEILAKAIAANTGRPHSEEQRAKDKRAARVRSDSEGWKEKQKQAKAAISEQRSKFYSELIGDLLEQDVPVKEIVKLTGLSQRTVFRWKARLNKKNSEAGG